MNTLPKAATDLQKIAEQKIAEQKVEGLINTLGPEGYEQLIASQSPPSPWNEGILQEVFVDHQTLSGLIDKIMLPCLDTLDTLIQERRPDSRHDRLELRATMRRMGKQLEPLLTPQEGYRPKEGAAMAFNPPSENIYENLAFEARNLFQDSHLYGRLVVSPEVMEQATDTDFIQARSQMTTHWMGIIEQAISAERVVLKKERSNIENDPSLSDEQKTTARDRLDTQIDLYQSGVKMLKSLHSCPGLALASHAHCDQYMQLFKDLSDWMKTIDTMDQSSIDRFSDMNLLLKTVMPVTNNNPMAKDIMALLSVYAEDIRRDNLQGSTIDAFKDLMVELKQFRSEQTTPAKKKNLFSRLTSIGTSGANKKLAKQQLEQRNQRQFQIQAQLQSLKDIESKRHSDT